jgi:chemotaxis protein methyltransferase CheR
MFSFFKKKNKTIEEDISLHVSQEPFNSFGFNDVLHYIKREIGVDLFPKKSIIETRLRVFCEERNLSSFKKLFDKIQYDTDIKQELINLVTVNETYFYRELPQLHEAIEFAKTREGTVSIICAPCATGEEVYTLAMLLGEEKSFQKNYEIKGIDINTEAIRKAETGYYSERSLHKLTQELKDRYFTCKDGFYAVDKAHFSNVKFSQVNIFEDRFKDCGKFDIIFSRNMLIYFDEEFRLAAMKRFYELLKPAGRVYLGHADIVPENELFIKHGFGSSCFYTKR